MLVTVVSLQSYGWNGWETKSEMQRQQIGLKSSRCLKERSRITCVRPSVVCIMRVCIRFC